MGFERLQLALSSLTSSGLRRQLKEMQGPQGRCLQYQGREFLNFSSNNYLGLAEHPRVSEAMIRGLREWGLGSGAARLVTGSQGPAHRLEEELAQFKGCEAALLFNSGYHANLGALSCLLQEGDVIFSDELNHASMIDGMRLSRAYKKIYRHLDVEDLRRQMEAERGKAAPGAQFLIASETVFSMDGDLAPLLALLRLAEEFDAWLYLDEAHATGVFGPKGAGLFETVENRARHANRVIQMGTLGKALGCFGAYVAGSRVLVDYLINRARPFIYTTALPPALAEAAREALRLVLQEPERRTALWDRIRQFDGGSGLAQSPIVPLIVGAADDAFRLSRDLEARGFWVSAIRPPTVPEATARLRVTLMASHQESDVDALRTALTELGLRFGTHQQGGKGELQARS